MSYETWRVTYPQAAQALDVLMSQNMGDPLLDIKSEAAAQQQVRFKIAKTGGMAWRNNVGATPSRCPDCGARHAPVRYGLANESSKINDEFKSSDIIAAIPRLITLSMVGSTIAQFGSIEVKPPGWVFTGKGREAGQARWLALIKKLGGYATFSTGNITL